MRHKEKRFLTLDVGGVGYKIFATEGTLESLKTGEEANFWTHLVVREDALDLYGFFEKETLDFFELLISIAGIGPRTALGVLNVATVKTLKRAVSAGDTSYLTKVSGIGKKISEKIVLELRDKFDGEEHAEGGTLQGEADAIEALKSLGYSEREAREALKKVSKSEAKNESGEKSESATSEKVRCALKILSEKKH